MTEPWLDSWSGIGHVTVGMARQGYDLQLTRLRREGLPRDLLRDGHGGLAHERDGSRVGADAAACGPGGSVEGAPSSTGQNSPMTMTQLVDLGVVLVGLVVAVVVAVFLGIWMKGDTRRSGRRRRL